MKIKKGRSLTALAMFNKRKNLRKDMKNSPARSLRNTSTPVSLKKKKSLSRISIPQNGVKSKSANNDASTSSSGAGNTDVIFGKTEAERFFEWLIHPLPPKKFFEEVFEKRAFIIRRQSRDYFKHTFSCKELDRILHEKHLKYSEDIDVTSYMNGVKKTHNGDGRAYAAVIWDSYQNGRSIRLLKPQAFSKSIWRLQSILADYFGCFVGGNIYLTPPGTQGFAPHYDDIEAFVLQLEGQKHWKVYSPKNPDQELPRFSSGNFSQEDLGEQHLDVTLSPGDLLYFPRGFIHQASTSEEEHSLHLTLSVYQRFTWGDLLEKLLPRTLQAAFEENIEYRKTLPIDFQSYMGVVHSDKVDPRRDAFLLKMKSLTEGLAKYLCTDAAVDQVAKDVIHSSLPPILTQDEKSRSIHGDGEYWKNNKVHNAVEIDLDTKICLLRKNAVRVVMEDNCVRLYHSLENTRTYKEVEAQYVEISFDLIRGVEALLRNYPLYTKVTDLPLDTDEEKLNLTGLLYDKGLLKSEFPLTSPQDE